MITMTLHDPVAAIGCVTQNQQKNQKGMENKDFISRT